MKRTPNYGWGQSIISPYRKYSDITLRSIMIQTHKAGKDIIDAIDTLNPRNQARALELYNECPTLQEALNA